MIQFIQFYSYAEVQGMFRRSSNGEYAPFAPKILYLGNGYSRHLSILEKIGKVLWVRYEPARTAEEMAEKNRTIPLPNAEMCSTVFVSALYYWHLHLAYVWAKSNPQCQIVVGGPAVRFTPALPHGILSNFKMETSTLDLMFGKGMEWRLTLPEESSLEDEQMPYSLFFTMPEDNPCYWGKCIFCSESNPDTKSRDCSIADERFFKNLPSFKGKAMLFYSTPVLHYNALQRFASAADSGPDNLTHGCFIRADKIYLEKLKKILAECSHPDRLMFRIGLEFPSKRMLSFVNKGIDLETFTELTHLICSSGASCRASMILGWNNLQENDLKETEKIVPQIHENVGMTIRQLIIVPNSKMDFMTQWSASETMRLGPFTMGKILALDRDQLSLNNIAHKLVFSRGFQTITSSWDIPVWGEKR